MTKEKQIEEMAKVICHAPTCEIRKNGGTCYKYCKAYIYAFRAINAGYRKASEVAMEIFSIIDDVVESWKIEVRSKEDNELIRTSYNGTMIVKCLAALKKKYTDEWKKRDCSNCKNHNEEGCSFGNMCITSNSPCATPSHWKAKESEDKE